MANERVYPLLPCADLDQTVIFYETLGFKRTYRQVRPNPYAVMAFEDIGIHLFGIEGFNPEESYGSVIIAVPDPESLYREFAAKLRERFGKLPVAGIPRILRPRKKYGTVYDFTVVDPGGNWLRISKSGDSEAKEKTEGLASIIEVAARLADAHGDDQLALKTLEGGLARFAHAATLERARELTDSERAAIAEDFAHAKELVQHIQMNNS